MSEGPVCYRCRRYLQHGEADASVCPECVEAIKADALHRLRDAILANATRSSAIKALDGEAASGTIPGDAIAGPT